MADPWPFASPESAFVASLALLTVSLRLTIWMATRQARAARLRELRRDRRIRALTTVSRSPARSPSPANANPEPSHDAASFGR